MSNTLTEIEAWATSRHLKLSNANADLLRGFITARKLELSVANLDQAANDPHLKFALEFEPGHAPKEVTAAPAPPKGNRFNQLADAGVRMARAEGDSHSERIAAAAREKEEAERQRQVALAKQKEAESLRQQRAEETQILFRESGPRKGEVDHVRTAAAQQAAKQKWAQIRGVATKPADYRIPLHPSKQQLIDGTTEELRVWSKDRRKAGLPASINI
jgi:hypothetical protein